MLIKIAIFEKQINFKSSLPTYENIKTYHSVLQCTSLIASKNSP